jgi:hypothetical protein
MGNDDPIYKKLLENMGFDYPIGVHHPGGFYIEFPGKGFNRICLLEYENDPQKKISLVVFAGDTCNQAKELFRHFSYTKVLDLEKQGWTIQNHFHFAWQRKIILRTKGDKELSHSEYIEYWRRELSKGNIRQYKKEEFGLLKARLREAKVMNEDDITAFDEFFRKNKYQSAITCPGIINRINFPKEKLNEKIEILSAELREKTMSLIKIYD